MKELDQVKVMEGLLFASDTPLSLEQLHQIFSSEKLDKPAIKKVIADLARSLEEGNRALQVVEAAGGYRLVTRKELGEWIRKLSRPKKVRLSAASLEVLAIIAYKQPVTTPEIEAIRGVNSSGVTKTLLERQLIKIAGRKDAVGNPMVYATTREFLEYFGLRSLRDLPTLKEFQEIMEEHEENMRQETEEEGVTPGSSDTVDEGTVDTGSLEPDGANNNLRSSEDGHSHALDEEPGVAEDDKQREDGPAPHEAEENNLTGEQREGHSL